MKHGKVRVMAMALAMILAISPLQSVAASQSQLDDEWLTGKSEYSIEGGQEETCYEIENAEDLRALSEEVKAGIAEEGAVYIQTKDIDMAEAENFEPIGTGNPFTGVYDGQGYKISNLKLTSDEDAVGLFGRIERIAGDENTGIVKNLTVENAEIVFEKGTGVQGVGILAGKMTDGTLENCTVLGGSLNGTDGVFADTFVGSLVGLVSGESTLVSCNSSETAGAPELLGGYGENAEKITLTNCLLNGEVYRGQTEEDAEETEKSVRAVQLNEDLSLEEAEAPAEEEIKSQPVSLVSIELDKIHAKGNEQYVLKDEVLNFDPNTYEYTIELKNSGPTSDNFTFVLDGPVTELSAAYRQNDGAVTSASVSQVSGQENTYKVSWVPFVDWGKTDLTFKFNYGTKVSPREKTYVFHILKNTENDNALKNFTITPYNEAGQAVEPLEEHIKSMLRFEALTIGADVRKLGVYAEAENPNNTLSLTYRTFADDEDIKGEIKTIEIPNGEEYFITDCFSQAYADDLKFGRFSGNYVNEFKLTVQPRNNQESRSYSKNVLWGNFKEDVFLNMGCFSKWTGNSAVQLQHTDDPEKTGYDFNVREYNLKVMDTSETQKGVLSLGICPKAGVSPYLIFGGKKLDLSKDFMADLGYMNQIGFHSAPILEEGEITDVSLDVYADAEYKEKVGSYLFHVFYAPSMRIEVSIKDTENLVPDSKGTGYAYFLKGEAEQAVLQVTGIPENAKLTWGGVEVEVTDGTAEIFVDGTETYGKRLECTYSGDWNDGTAPSYSVSVSCKRPPAGMPDTIVDFWPAPGQFTNSKDWGMAQDDNALMNGIGVSLGGYGGYITARLASPIQNDPKNAGGMDFVVKGNAFAGNSEPANVLVSKDGKQWYTLAGGYHYEDDCIWDYKITYSNENPENPDSGTRWTDNQGNSGVIAANGYHAQSYYPLTENYGKYREDSKIPNSYSCEGVLLPGRVSSWGYVDAAASGITGDMQTPIQGNLYGDYYGFDLSWAVDKNGDPVALDEINYVRVQNATNNIVPPFGELSAEVSRISTENVAKNDMVDETLLAADIVVNGQSLNLQSSDIKYDRIVEKTVYYNDENQDFNVSVTLDPATSYTYNNVLIGNASGTSRHYSQIPKHKKIRIVTQSYSGPWSRANNAMIYYITFEKKDDYMVLSTSESELYMKPGDEKTLTGAFAPSVPEDTGLTWSSTNEDVATVDGNGKVTAVAAGSANIVAVSKATGAKASCSVQVGAVSDGCMFQAGGAAAIELTVVEGKPNTGVRLFATLLGNTNGELVDKNQFTLTSSDESIVTVKKTTRITTASGGYNLEITGQKPGEADITAMTSAGKKAILHVTVEPKATQTAILSVEKFTLGQGYVIEPTQVTFQEGDSAAKVLTKFLEDQGYSYKYTGEVDNGFYIASIKNADTGILNVPEEIKAMTNFDKMWNGINPDYPNLGEFAYAKQSGWIYHVNEKAADVGMSEYTLKDGDVMRLQFTLHGLGADFGGSSFGDVTALEVANKDRLTLRVADWAAHEEDFLCIQKYKDIYEHALEVLQNHMAAQEEVDAAEAAMPFMEAVPMTSFTVDTAELEIGMGEEAAVQTEVVPSGASDKELIYTSSAETVAKVSGDGTITGTGKGEAVITVVPRGIRLDGEPADYAKEIRVTVVLAETQLLDYVKELIEALPDSEKITLSDKKAVEKAAEEYEALTLEQQEKLGEEIQKKVTGTQEKLAALQKEYSKKLQDAIDAAKEWKKDEYTENSWNFLQDAIQDAEALLTGDFTEKEISIYADYLKMAVDGLVKKEDSADPGTEPDKINKDALGALLETAELLLEKTDIYTAASLYKLKTAYTTALKVYKEEKSTQTQVDAQMKVLKGAVEALDKKPDKKPDTKPDGGQTATNTKRKVSLTGEDVTSDMILKVTPMTASDSRVKAMQKKVLTTQSLGKLYEAALLLDGEEVELTKEADLEIYVGSADNGKTLTALHYADGEVEKLAGKVRNGYLTVEVSDLGAFGVIMQEADQKGTGEQIKVSPVKTGDSAPVVLWLSVALFAAAVSILIWKKRRTVR